MGELIDLKICPECGSDRELYEGSAHCSHCNSFDEMPRNVSDN